MSNIAVKGATTGTGTFTLESPATNTDRTLTIPDVDGSIVTANASGNVGIGTTSPTSKLSVNGNVDISGAGFSKITYLQTTNAVYSDVLANSGGTFQIDAGVGTATSEIRLKTNNKLGFWLDNTNDISFYEDTGTTAKLFWDASAESLLVGTTSSFGSGVGFCGFANGNAALRLKRGADYGATARFYNFGGSEVGSITVNASSTSYVTSSDYRLKEDWSAVANASTRVNALQPVNFAWIASGERVDGFLAHELAEVVPEAVTGTKDAVDDEGNPVYQGIDQSKLVPLLTAALQEALARIETLEADVATLKGTP